MLENPTPDPMARLRGAVAVALILLVAAATHAATRWSVEIDGRSHPIRSRVIANAEYLTVSDLVKAFGGLFQMDRRSGNFVYELQGRRIVLSSTEGLVSLDAKILTFPSPNRLIDGELWVVPDFVMDVVAPIYDRPIKRDGTSFKVSGAAPVDVKFRASQDAGGTRAVLEFSRRVPYQVDSDTRGVRLRTLGVPLREVGFPSEVPGTEIKGLGFEPAPGGVGGTFALEAGPTYGGVRISELEGPFRVVFDFARAGGTLLPTSGALSAASPAFQPPAAHGIRTIVLDPGHGGPELGAEGPTGLAEKNVVLDIAQRTARLLEKRLGVEVLLTRERDQDIPLDERAAIANHHRGDLFVSIHANASPRRSANGAETYFLAYQAVDDDASRLALRENQGRSVSPGSKPEGLEMVLWEMAQAEHLAESFSLAQTIQEEFNQVLATKDRGVRQAPFRVLVGAAMPAVLVEVAFITNPKEERLLRTIEFRNKIADALVASIARYKEEYEQRLGLGERRPFRRGGS